MCTVLFMCSRLLLKFFSGSRHSWYMGTLVLWGVLGWPGLLPDTFTSGNQYILVVANYFTCWAEAFPLPNQEADTVAAKLVDEVFLRFSVPEQLHSDQGRQFESQLIKEVCKLLKVEKTRTTPYHPQGDGLVERFNQTLLNMLAICAKDHPVEWEHHIQKVCMVYNSSVQSSTGYIPFYLMFGCQARLPVDIMCSTREQAPQSQCEYARDLQTRLYRQPLTWWDKLSARNSNVKRTFTM